MTAQLTLALGPPVPVTSIATRRLAPWWRFDAYRGFREWLTQLWQHGYMHGSTMLDMMQEVCGANCIDNGTADDLLNEAAQLGWIVRQANEPTTSQRAFAGLMYRGGSYHGWTGLDGNTAAQFHATHWYWAPNRDNADARAWLGKDAK